MEEITNEKVYKLHSMPNKLIVRVIKSMRWDMQHAQVVQKYDKFLVENLKRPDRRIGRPRSRLEDNIKIGLREKL